MPPLSPSIPRVAPAASPLAHPAPLVAPSAPARTLSLLEVQRLVAAGAFRTLAVGDRNCHARDASDQAGSPALACDLRPSAGAPGAFFRGDVHALAGLPPWWRVLTFMPCEQQTKSMKERVAAIKGLDGRMWAGLRRLLRAWCIIALCLAAEQPDVYLIDFYDALFIVTSPSEWDADPQAWQKKTLVFYRGTSTPVPPFPGKVGTKSWHNAKWRSPAEVADARSVTQLGFARGLAEQIVPDGSGVQPLLEVELERLAAAWGAHLPLPSNYLDYASAEDRLDARGDGDGVRVCGVTPLLLLDAAARQERLASPPYSGYNAATLEALRAATIPAVSACGAALGRAAHAHLVREAASASPSVAAAAAAALRVWPSPSLASSASLGDARGPAHRAAGRTSVAARIGGEGGARAAPSPALSGAPGIASCGALDAPRRELSSMPSVMADGCAGGERGLPHCTAGRVPVAVAGSRGGTRAIICEAACAGSSVSTPVPRDAPQQDPSNEGSGVADECGGGELCGSAGASSQASPGRGQEAAVGRDVVSFGSQLHLGSSRPHALDGGGDAPPAKVALRGGLRQLERERVDVLLYEPLPDTNVCLCTPPEEPPADAPSPPGPFTDDELLPPGLLEEVIAYGTLVGGLLARAERGGRGWRAAANQRPAPRNYTEAEALNPCGRGWRWRRGADGLWHALTASRVLSVPAETSLDATRFEELAARDGMQDEQLLSWLRAGMPGSRRMEPRAQLAPPHVGAFKQAAIFAAGDAKDEAAGFVTGGCAFPDVWPCIIDPMNVVMQHDKGRVTIDKTMLVSGDEELPSYNLLICLKEDEAGRRYLLVRIAQFARACAVLEVASMFTFIETVVSKFDLKAFFRQHGKQRKDIWQSGRLTRRGYGTDLRVNFGECDAPDHTGRSSNATAFSMKRECKRLEAEYPPVEPTLLWWLERRRSVRPAELSEADDMLYAVLFYLMFYVDDGGLACVNDLLYTRSGEPVIELVTGADGSVKRVHQRRASLYFQACIGVADYVGHGTPEDKRQYPGRVMVLIGFEIDLPRGLIALSEEKAGRYSKQLSELLSAAQALTGGLLRVRKAKFDQLLHRLLHASEVVPLGRSHLFYCLQTLRQVNRLEGNEVILSRPVLAEFEWWFEALPAASSFAVPLASRSTFPGTCDGGVLTHYGDASREYDESSGVMAASSGFGSWTVVEGVFYYLEGRWQPWECAAFSINVLEFATEQFGTFTFAALAASLDVQLTHVHAFTDNTTAEHVSERGRTQSEGLSQLNQRRQHSLVELGLFQETSRVASVFNDIADLLSRGDVDEALRFPRDALLDVVRVPVLPAWRDLSQVARTWS